MNIACQFGQVGIVYGDQWTVCRSQFSLSITWGWETEQGFKACQQVPVPAEQAQCPSVCVCIHMQTSTYMHAFSCMCVRVGYCLMFSFPSRLYEKKPFFFNNLIHYLSSWKETKNSMFRLKDMFTFPYCYLCSQPRFSRLNLMVVFYCNVYATMYPQFII